MKIFAIAGNSVRLLFRDRSNIFFVLILPIVLILVIGLVFGGGFTPRVGVARLDVGEPGVQRGRQHSRVQAASTSGSGPGSGNDSAAFGGCA